MRKLLSIALLVVLLATTASSALAQPVQCVDPADGLVHTPNVGLYFGGWAPYTFMGDDLEFAFFVQQTGGGPLIGNHPVDIYLWRPPTADVLGNKIWPLQAAYNVTLNDFWTCQHPGLLPTAGSFWREYPASEIRRQSYPDYQMTDGFGFYYAKFMLPRENTWYPCGYPCRWECNSFDAVNGFIFHSPVYLDYVYPDPVLRPFDPRWPLYFPLYWPWFWDYIADDWFLDTHPTLTVADVYPGDTVHPLVAVAWDAFWGAPLLIYPYEVDGYYWRTSDLEQNWPEDWPALCPEDLLFNDEPVQ